MSPLVWAKYFPSPPPAPSMFYQEKSGTVFKSPREKDLCRISQPGVSNFHVLNGFGANLEYFAKSHKPVKTYRTENGILTF